MKATLLFAAILALPVVTFAKSETTRIEIARGKAGLLTLEGPEEAGQFTIWTGPGTSMTSGGTTTTPTSPHDFADWAGGPVKAPRKLEVYSVRFYCAAAGETPKESIPSHQCYGVRYAHDRSGERGYIQIPSVKDREFPLNGQSIYRGVEGKWFRASERWEQAVRPRLQAARAAQRQAESAYQPPPYIYTPPSPRAVGATPRVTPKPR